MNQNSRSVFLGMPHEVAGRNNYGADVVFSDDQSRFSSERGSHAQRRRHLGKGMKIQATDERRVSKPQRAGIRKIHPGENSSAVGRAFGKRRRWAKPVQARPLAISVIKERRILRPSELCDETADPDMSGCFGRSACTTRVGCPIMRGECGH